MRPAIVFFDAWHTLFTVRAQGPERLMAGLRALDLSFDEAAVPAAMNEARQRIQALDLPFIRTPVQERAWFTTLNRLTLEALDLDPAHAERLAEAALYVPYCFLYDDVWPALDGVRARGYRVGLLSNAYPSLLDALRRLQVLDRFDPLVLSCDVGCEKPALEIYHSALAAAGVTPHEAVFIDDQPANISAADEVGMVGLLLDRAAQHAGLPLRRIERLTDVLDHLDPTAE